MLLAAGGHGRRARGSTRRPQQADGTLAAAPYNLALLYRHRARGLPDAQVGAELERAAQTMAVAQPLDDALRARGTCPRTTGSW